MWFKHRAWIPVAWLASALNLAGVWFAARPAEPWHATTHALLAVLFALGARRLSARRQALSQGELLQQTTDQNEQLRYSMGGMQARLSELEERVDFAERLLARQREGDRVSAPERQDQ
jgi:membrane protein implicated in regulation of membrane protease activity